MPLKVIDSPAARVIFRRGSVNFAAGKIARRVDSNIHDEEERAGVKEENRRARMKILSDADVP